MSANRRERRLQEKFGRREATLLAHGLPVRYAGPQRPQWLGRSEPSTIEFARYFTRSRA